MHYFDEESSPYYWKRSSTLDWCEENYTTSSLIAEFYNTLSNLINISLAIYGIHNARTQSFEPRFQIAYLSVLIIGIGSWFFHMTLHFTSQLVDELGMIYATVVFLYILIESGKSNKYGRVLPFLLFMDAFLITVYYMYSKNPLFHQVMNGINTVAIVGRGIYVFHYELKVQDKEMGFLVRVGCALYLLGFGAWNLDNLFCEQLRWVRQETVVGGLFGPLLQFHGWWHVGTGLGSYYFTVFCQLLRLHILEKEDEYELVYKLKVIPVLKRTKQGKLV